MAGHVERRHPERIRLELERLLAAQKRFAGKRIDFRDLLVGHSVDPAEEQSPWIIRKAPVHPFARS